MTAVRDTDQLLRKLDPGQACARSSLDEQEARLQQILRTSRPAPHRPRGPHWSGTRKWGVVAVGTAVVAAAAVVGPQLFRSTAQPAYAVTPPSLALRHPSGSAQDRLDALAEKVAELPDESATGTQRFVQDSWSLSTRIDGEQVTSAVVPERRVTVKKPDGSKTWRVRSQKPQFQNEQQRKRWKDAGATGERTVSYSGSSGPADSSDPRTHRPPTDTEGMERWLRTGYHGSGPGELFDSIAERSVDTAFTPKERSALLRVLAHTRGVAYRGAVEDRAGRSGLAFSVNSRYGGLPKTQTLVFGPGDGKLRSYDEQLTKDAGALNVRVPAVTLYITYLEEG
ncbi:CU044_5270 family protein [Streptomyces sp. NPDC007088]|uniref:CU044_5270 family protein n=1 Tax=Streptomyces sp. NPDC007088 TaxID=3364773 RepID=UPI003690B2C8